MDKYSRIKGEAYEGNMQLPALGLVLFTFGNMSVADRELGVFAIKPSGVKYQELTPASMVVVDFDGHIIEGTLRPSSDTKTHGVLYKSCAGIEAIVHTHSTYATAWAQSLRDIPVYGTTHADHMLRDIPCAPPMDDEKIMGDYEYETGLQILQCLKDRNLSYEDVKMIIVGNHAPFAWGKSMQEAVYNAAVLEEIARIAYLTEQIEPDVKRMKEALARKHFDRKHGKGSYYGQ